ncbi:MAG: molybdenum cofactor guanylyltransferase [Reinekea forsetii]|jgi:molybdopterin-guanine dinucleotide biosynthesis protein A|uniref:Molybdopterin-guanine dinucleotide biosynthesis protein MobA n=2 Tax=Reinekea TaxID=230494 RepID=A0A2K8KTL9_9GAMM|nr:molybdenum cofactor guanylyltransferase [Reinekea forsetii]ATX76246.1 molybdopterin-guanine dinucleotide biosynthesis protein MobA [Reinekea forsetii]MDO7642662.1 molybdenum cofactor guanylyltransferase [Reinekea forsetii]MDO7644282.1 molybdenum cofactor guanylyltransferase [Reinekea forsetii]MDO7674342.1 molybdenum cofactor guanylyltransferase [Reinekea forsetii]
MSAAILLLSGGRSTRMGQDKATLAWAGQSLLSWQRHRFERAGSRVLCGLSDRFADYPGPLAGIDSACAACPDLEGFVVVPVDMPSLSSAAVQYLARQGAEKQRLSAFVGHPMPLYVPNSPAIAQLLARWLADPEGPRSVTALIEHQDGQWLAPEPYQNELTNINTPDQWRHFLAGELHP